MSSSLNLFILAVRTHHIGLIRICLTDISLIAMWIGSEEEGKAKILCSKECILEKNESHILSLWIVLRLSSR